MIRIDVIKLRQAFGMLKFINDDSVTLVVDREGMWYRGMNSSHTAMVNMKIPIEEFKEYDVILPTQIQILQEQQEMIDRILEDNLGEDLEIYLPSKTTESLDSVRGKEKEQYKVTFVIAKKESRIVYTTKNVEEYKEGAKDVKLEHTFKAKVRREEFLAGLRLGSKITDFITLINKGKELIIESQLENTKIETKLSVVNQKEEATTQYNLSYLIDIMKSLTDDEVEILYSKERPIEIRARYGKIIIAPRVER